MEDSNVRLNLVQLLKPFVSIWGEGPPQLYMGFLYSIFNFIKTLYFYLGRRTNSTIYPKKNSTIHGIGDGNSPYWGGNNTSPLCSHFIWIAGFSYSSGKNE